jgi:hypothetical protein
VLVKLSGRRLVEATIKAIVDTTEGIRLQVDFGYTTGRSLKRVIDRVGTSKLGPLRPQHAPVVLRDSNKGPLYFRLLLRR